MVAKKRKKLTRPKKGRMVAGVCLGIANYFEVDPTLVRLVWILLLIPGGIPGLVPYALAWIVMPEK